MIIATYRRPEYVRTCLAHLAAQTVAPVDIVVVDASRDDLTHHVVSHAPGVRYLRNERGAGSTATSRAIGVGATRGEILAFVDDDAYADPDWLEQLLLRYDDPSVAAVGGRARNGQPNEESEGIGEIGRLLPNGRLTGYFAADPGRDVEVDHVLGANMSLRRSVVDSLGGIQDHYPGTCLREETEMPLRMRQAGYRVIYTPDAIVRHVAGPYARGKRFDLRYSYFGQRNHVVLLARTTGARSRYFRRYLLSAAREIGADFVYAGRSIVAPERTLRSRIRGGGGGLARALVKSAGLFGGALQATRLGIAGRR